MNIKVYLVILMVLLLTAAGVNEMMIKDGVIENTPIGQTTPAKGSFTDLKGQTLQSGDSSNYMATASDGEVSLVGTARVYKSIWLPFNALKVPGTKPATFKEWGISGAWEFSDATDDTIVCNIMIPLDMDVSVAPSLNLGWSTHTAVATETALWQLEYLYTSPGEETVASAEKTLTDAGDATTTADALIVTTINGIGAPSATDKCFHARIKRLGANATDDLTDTAELHGLCYIYTSNKLGDGL